MKTFLRLSLLGSASLGLLSAAGVAGAQPASAPGAAPPPVERDHVWAQTYSDLPADPAILFGALPNGMRYAIMRNDTPTHQVSLRLCIGSGSLEEDDADQGLAHFMEHMSFDGSTHVPKGEMVKSLQRLGLGFGADTNAFTAFTETVFQFDLPEADARTVGTGLMLMREIAGNSTIAPDALNAERGVVLSEERLRDTPEFEALKQRLAFDFKDQLVAHRLPIGLVSVIKGATSEQMRALYHANYRPDRATLVVVGDIDPRAMEAEIRARFSDWPPVGPQTPSPDYGSPPARGPETQLIVRPGVAPSISIDWVAPYDDTPDTRARERCDLVERIGLMALNRRFERQAHGDDPPFIQAAAFRQNFERSAKPATLELAFKPQGWRAALDAAVRTQRQAVQYGLSQAEVDREVVEYRVQLRNAAAGAATRRSPDIANEIARTVDDREVDTAPSEDLALFDADVRGLTAGEVSTALAHAFTGAGPLLSMDTPDPVDGGEAAVAAAFAQARNASVAPPAAQAAKAWTYTDFGAPGRVVEQRTVPDLGVTFVRFANGVRLTVKPTAFRKDQTLVSVRFNHGRLALPKDSDPSTWAASAFIQAGLRGLSYEDVQQALASKTASIDLRLEDDAFAFNGTTRPQDLDVQLQLIAAYMTAPGWRPEAYQQARTEIGVALDTLSATPQGVETRDLAQLEHAGDDRWHVPTPAEVRDDPIAPFHSLMQHALSAGPLEVEVVGDVTVDQAVAAVAATFGALAPRPADAALSGDLAVRFPAPDPTPILRTHTGRADQAIAYIAWPTFDLFSDPQRARAMNVAAEVLDSRLVDQIRIAEGATYSPVSRSDASETFPDYGYAFASVETPPAKIASFYASVDRITADIAQHGITADELQRARAPRLEALAKSQQTNEYWIARLANAATDPERLTIIRDTLPGYVRLTADDVRRTAAAYLTSSRSWRFEVEPANPSPTAGSGSGSGATAAAPPARSTAGSPTGLPTSTSHPLGSSLGSPLNRSTRTPTTGRPGQPAPGSPVQPAPTDPSAPIH